ncbi:MAG: hypothetical protein ACI3XZ_01395 [Butyricicoccus sp.]
MEPIPLCTRHVIATSTEDFALLDRAPEALVGALAASTKTFARMLEQNQTLPVGMSLPCPPVPENLEMPKTERYIALCKEAFRPRMQDKAAFYYLRGAEDFRSLRAAVLALTDMSGRTIIAELHVDEEGRMADGTDCLAAVGVLQRIGVSTVILSAADPEALEDALERIAPYARLSVGVSVPCAWLRAGVKLTNVEVLLPAAHESALRVWQALVGYTGGRTVGRDHDDVILAPDGCNAHFIDAVTDISDEIDCDHHLEENLLEMEDQEASALKVLIHEEDDLYNLETDLYMLSRPVCLCAENPELLEKALRIYSGLAIYDGTWEQDLTLVKYFSEKYGMICL